jgi:hypothetical protein
MLWPEGEIIFINPLSGAHDSHANRLLHFTSRIARIGRVFEIFILYKEIRYKLTTSLLGESKN